MSAAPQPEFEVIPGHARRRWKLWAWSGGAVVLAGLWLWAGQANWDTAATHPIALGKAQSGPFQVLVRVDGQVAAAREALLKAPRHVPSLQIVYLSPAGSKVKQGQVVVRFDPTGAEAQLRSQLAALHQAQAAVRQAQAQQEITSHQDAMTLATAREVVAQDKLQVKQAAILSAIQGAEARVALGLTEQQYKVDQASARLDAARGAAQIASLQRKLDKAQYEYNLTARQLSKMTVRAPVSGRVAYRMNMSQGWMNATPFKIGDQVWPGAVIGSIPESRSLGLEGQMNEDDRGQVRVGDAVMTRIPALPDREFNGRLTRISLLTETTYTGNWPPQRKFHAFAQLASRDPRLRAGMNGVMDIVVRRLAHCVHVPAQAVFIYQGKSVVYVPHSGKYQAVPVTILARNPDAVAVSGIAAGTMVALARPPAAAIAGGGR